MKLRIRARWELVELGLLQDMNALTQLWYMIQMNRRQRP